MAGGHRAPTERIASVRAGERKDGDVVAAFVEHRHMHGTGIAPQPEQGPVAGGEPIDGEAPAGLAVDDARPGPVMPDPFAFDGVDQCHRDYPSSLATFWNQATTTGGR